MTLKPKEKKLLIALGIVAVIAAVMLYRIYGPKKHELKVISESKKEEKKDTKTAPARSYGGGGGGGRGSSSSSNTKESVLSVSLDDFTKNNKLESCWVIIEGEVYNITNYLKEYDSDIDGISQYCGTFGFEVGYLNEKSSLSNLIKDNSLKIGKIG
jgi:hypothetical protein